MKFEKLSMQTWFFIGGLVVLWFIQSKNIDPSGPLKILSGIFLAFPFILLTVFAVPYIRTSIKRYYRKERDQINRNIKEIRKEQEKITDIKKLIELDQEVLTAREELRGVKSNRFEKSSIYSIVWFSLSLLIIYLDLGIYLDIQSKIIGTIAFFVGVYYLSIMIKALFVVFEN